jgi:hypothetical protein
MLRTPFFTDCQLYSRWRLLTSKDSGLVEDVKLSLKVVGGLGNIGVLEEDERQTGSLVNGLVAGLGSAGLVAETKPSVTVVSSGY